MAHHRVEQLHLELGHHADQRLDGLAGPAVAADHRRVLGARPESVGEEGGVGGQRMRSGEHGQAPMHDGAGVHQRAGELAGVQRREVEALDGDAAVGERGGEVVDHQPRAVVHGDVRQADDVLRLAAGPVAVGLDDELRVVVHRARGWGR